ncbi:hypothetical protein BDZ89DRAFT_1074364 [Hymenopellis radicata]|nr:hypothetical protein BDZ89DRAFT_1074364 [Hymenopellis radicata]
MAFVEAMLFEFPRTQLAQSDPQKWDAEWEALFKNKPVLCDVNYLFHTESQFRNPLRSMDVLYRSYQIFLISTCTIQQRIGHLSILHGAELDEKWTAASVSDREHHALRALSGVCTIAKNLNDARAYCPRELRLERMTKDPKVMLDLLRSIVPGKEYISKPPETPYYIPSDDWDALAKKKETSATEMGKVTHATMLMLRTKLIYLVVECTFHSLIGKDFPEVVVLKNKAVPIPKEAKSSGPNPIREMIMGKAAAKATEKEDIKAVKERARQRQIICQACGAAQSPDGPRFMQCSACRSKMDRLITYCSPACQKAHWKIHKPTCGKPMTFESIAESSRIMNGRVGNQASSSSSPPQPDRFAIGPPVGGFKRSRALELHIRRLAEFNSKKADLFLRCGPTPKDDLAFQFPAEPKEIRELCLAARQAAMTRGDRPTIAVLCHFVLWALVTGSMPGIGYAVDTMSQEFEYPLSALKADILEQQAKQSADPFARPPLLGSVPALNWGAFVNSASIDRNAKVTF